MYCQHLKIMEVDQVTERLTEIINDRNAVRDGICGTIGNSGRYFIGKAIDKLAEYETAEEEGGLVVLPCKVGDVVYAIEDKYYEYLYHKGIQKGHVCRFEYDKEWFVWIHIDGCNKDLQIAYKTSNFNQTVFLTREEAEKALKEIKKEENKCQII